MLITRKYNSLVELQNLLNGTPIIAGAAGTNGAGSPNLQDLTVNAFAGVAVGDRILISGELSATVFLVGTVTDVNNLVLDTNIVAAHAAGPTIARWRAVKNDGIPVADVQFGLPISVGGGDGGFITYETDVFF